MTSLQPVLPDWVIHRQFGDLPLIRLLFSKLQTKFLLGDFAVLATFLATLEKQYKTVSEQVLKGMGLFWKNRKITIL